MDLNPIDPLVLTRQEYHQSTTIWNGSLVHILVFFFCFIHNSYMYYFDHPLFIDYE